MANDIASIDTIFRAAIEIPSAEDRADFIARACGGHNELRVRVEKLVSAHFRAGSFLEEPAGNTAPTVDEPPISEQPGTVIGPYKLMEQIGEGGMGLIFVAEQQAPVRRRVALKIIKPGMDSREVIARFEAERQALALMEHPNIAKVFDAGMTLNGRPYFVMELVKGVPIIDYCDQQQLTARQRLELFIAACHAVQHAHGKGIIHRDLKPSNILVAPHDGVPVVKVIDFGVAKAIGQQLTDKTIYTRFAQMIGTPLYMSPEQAEINALDVDIRSDVYSLGVLLYELLTGTTPFDRERFATAAFDEVRRIIREEEPPTPSKRLSELGRPHPIGGISCARLSGPTLTLATVSARRNLGPAQLWALVKGELDWIVMKCLEKDRNRRYETATSLAQDIQRYLHDEPVQAGPPSTAYRLRKFVKRNRGPVIAASGVLAALLAGIAGTTWGLVEALHQQGITEQARKDEAKQHSLAVAKEAEALEQTNLARKAQEAAVEGKLQAQQERDRAEELLYANQIVLAQREWEAGKFDRAKQVLADCRPEPRAWEHNYLHTLINQEERTLTTWQLPFICVAFSPDGKRLVSGHLVSMSMWDAQTGHELYRARTGQVSSVAFSPDGSWLVTSTADDGRLNSTSIRFRDPQTGRELRRVQSPTGPIISCVLSPDGKRLVSENLFGSLRLWDAETGKEMRRFKGHGAAFSPDSKRLVTGLDTSIKIWDVESGKEISTLKGHTGGVACVTFSPGGTQIASGGQHAGPEGGASTAEIKLWDAQSGAECGTRRGHSAAVNCIVFSPDGKLLVSGSADRTIKVWDVQSGLETRTIKGHLGAVNSVAFSPDGKRLVSAGSDGAIKLWEVKAGRESLTGHQGGVTCLAFSPDGQRLVSGSTDRTLKLSEVPTGQQTLTLTGHVQRINSVAFSPDGKRLASACAAGALKLWNAHTGKETSSLKGHTASVLSVAFSQDGNRIASGGGSNRQNTPFPAEIKVWDANSGQAIHTLGGHTLAVTTVAFSPDGALLASGSLDMTVKIWNAQTGQELHSFKGHTQPVNSVAFSPDGKRLVSGSADNTVKVWNVHSGREIATGKGHTTGKGMWEFGSPRILITSGLPDHGYLRGVTTVAFCPDGKRVVSGGEDKSIKVWDAQTGREILTLNGHTGWVYCLAFARDGTYLASGGEDKIVKLWDARKKQNPP